MQEGYSAFIERRVMRPTPLDPKAVIEDIEIEANDLGSWDIKDLFNPSLEGGGRAYIVQGGKRVAVISPIVEEAVYQHTLRGRG